MPAGDGLPREASGGSGSVEAEVLGGRARILSHEPFAHLRAADVTARMEKLEALAEEQGRCVSAMRQMVLDLREECSVLANCLADSGMLPWPVLRAAKGRRRAAAGMRSFLEVQDLCLILGKHMGFFSSVALAQSSKRFSRNMRPVLPDIAAFHPSPQFIVVGGVTGPNYLFPGQGRRVLGTVEAFDTKTHNWVPCQPLPTPRHACAAATVGSKLYVAGGSGVHDEEVAAVEQFDITTNRWTRLPPLPTPRCECAATGAGGSLFVLGGRNRGRPGNLLGICERFDPQAGRWSQARPMPTARRKLAAASTGGCVYALGGLGMRLRGNPTGARNRNNTPVVEQREEVALSTVERYEPATDSWTELPTMLQPRYAGAAWARGDRLYIAGGNSGLGPVRGGGGTLADVEIFEINLGVWFRATPMQGPRESLVASVIGESVLVAGGDDGLQETDIVECYNMATGVWTACPCLPTRRTWCAAAVASHL